MALAPDGQTLASTSADRTTRLWNVATGLELLDVNEPEAVGRLVRQRQQHHHDARLGTG